MQRTTQSLGTTEEHARLTRGMQLPDASKDHIPVRPSKVGRTPQSGNSILIGIRIIDHNVSRIIDLDLSRQVRMDLNAMINILGLDGQ